MHTQQRLNVLIKCSADLTTLSLAFLLSAFLAKSHAYGSGSPFTLERLELVLWTVLLAAWFPSARILGLYDDFRARYSAFEFTAVFKISLVQFLVSAFLLFVIKTVVLNRYFSLVYLCCLVALLGAEKTAMRLYFRRQQARGRFVRSLLVVGGGEVGRRFGEVIAGQPGSGYRVVGILDDQAVQGLPFPWLGVVDRLEEVLAAHVVDEVIVALPRGAAERLEQVTAVCANWPVQVRIIPDYFQFLRSRFSVSTFGNFPLISIHSIPLEELHWRFVKRLFDLVVTVALFLLVFCWLWPLIALAIRLTSRGPVFFRQERWGQRNRRILCYKFRTMRTESRDTDAAGRYLQATRDDPRITAVGRFLRRTNLDELPQFINVLRGDMSVVGPRPHPTPLNLQAMDHVDRYLARHMVRPGITGWAQVNGFRGETRTTEQMRKRVECDIWYIENWSFWLDLQIIWLTVWNTLRGDPNAY